MFDLIILLDGKSYFKRSELISSLKLQHSDNHPEEELYSKGDNKNCLLAYFTKDLNDYSDDDYAVIPYKVSGVCHLTFYPFELINEILYSIAQFNSELFVDDDHGNILGVCDYKILAEKKKVYPYTYHSSAKNQAN